MDLQKKFYVALAMFAALGLLAWLTLTDSSMLTLPIPVGWERGQGAVFSALHLKFRTTTLCLLGLFAFRTWLHWRAEKIRAEREQHEPEFTS